MTRFPARDDGFRSATTSQDARLWYHNGRMHDATDLDATGQMLLSENVRSVRTRYPKDGPEDLPGPCDAYWILPYKWRALGARSIVALLKAIDCYDYQSCESADWEHTEAYAFCQALRSHAISQLDGYDDAAWEIPEPRRVALVFTEEPA